MRRYLISSIVVIGTIIATGCDDYTVTDKAKVDACAAGVVLTKADYDQLKRDAELGKSVGRYQIHRDASRTWRLARIIREDIASPVIGAKWVVNPDRWGLVEQRSKGIEEFQTSGCSSCRMERQGRRDHGRCGIRLSGLTGKGI
jgi:hypothetical protein